jgi:short-subunit dehydrogenase
MLDKTDRPLAVVTGASTGIGLQLARQCAEHGFDLIIAANEPEIEKAADELRLGNGKVEAVQADLATIDGNEKLYHAIRGRPVAALLANAGRGLGQAFLDQDFNDIRYVIDTNITGTLYLIQKVARDMRARGEGKILITGSIAGFMPGAYHAVYNATKAFVDSFSYALREEMKDTGVTVTCLMPGPTEADFFRRAGLLDTEFATQEKASPIDVAKDGFKSMMAGDGGVVSGFQNKMQAALAHILPAETLARQHTKKAKPGTAENAR